MMAKHALFNNIFALVLLFSFQLAPAVVPSTMNYQGYLTDSSGVPIDGPVNAVFAIYDVEVGGTALWTESQSVTVSQGVFSVELGSISPFPFGLESPLWLGLTVDTDTEMTPRRPFSSVGFAFRASDADALEGMSASSLDQSAHVIDTANPHNVTAAQTGAADAATLSAHTSDASNPHSVTAAQTGAADLTDYVLHALNPGAHHLRYTDSEAVTAMGAINDGNPLNHDKYTDPNAVAAILAADGAGSTLDSDKVDGLEASELIDAAQDEVRTPISALPYTINQSGSYYLTGSLDGSSGGIVIRADDVTLDMMGFTIDGGGINDIGIQSDIRSNITIRNGSVKNFGFSGVFVDGRFHTVMDVQVLDNGALGNNILAFASGMFISSSNNHIERCTAGGNNAGGIYVAGYSSKLFDNVAYNNTESGIYGGFGSILKDNTAYANGVVGISGGGGSTLSGNTAYFNTGIGISGSFGSVLSGNAAYDNRGGYGIYGAAGSTLIGNTAYSNNQWGIGVGDTSTTGSSSLVKDNTIYLNQEGGLWVLSNSHVVSNTLDNNANNNIYVSGAGNSIKNNHVSNSTNGINFITSGNYYRDNTATGNVSAFLNGASQIDGGGNVAF